MRIKFNGKNTSVVNDVHYPRSVYGSEVDSNPEQVEAEYKSLFDLAPNGIITVDLKGYVRSCNKAFTKLAGYSKEEIVGKHFSKLPTLRAKDIPQYVKIFTSIVTGKTLEPFDFKWIRGDGAERLGEIQVALVKVNGHYQGMMAVLWDITERDKTTKALRDSEENLKRYLDSAPDAIYISDMKGTLLYGNKKAEVITGYQREELIGKNFMNLNLLPPKSLAKTVKLLATGTMGISTGPDELEIRKKDGSLIPVEVSSTPIKEKGKFVAIGFVRDISDRIQTKKKLQESEESYRLLVENANEAIIVVQDGMFKFANAKASELSSYPINELLTKPVIELIFPDDKEMVAGYHNDRIEGKSVPKIYSFRLVRKDNTITWAEVNGVLITWEGKPASLNFINDITERKRFEEDREALLEKLRGTVESTINAIATLVEKRDPITAGHQRRVAKLTAAIAEELGLPEEQIVTLKVAGLLHDIGKVEIPSQILNKSSRLSDAEYKMVQYHVEAGYDILKTLELPWDICLAVFQHHERMNGSGYPKGISGEDICLGARILSVAEVVEAMSSIRPYRPSLGMNKTLEEISLNKGDLFDADVVDACLRLFNEKRFVFE